jgi:hypothetical protein
LQYHSKPTSFVSLKESHPNLKAPGLIGKPLPSKAEQLGSNLAKTASDLIKPENIKQVNIGLQKTGQVALTASKFIATALVDAAKFGYGMAKAGEELVFSLDPERARGMKRVMQVSAPLLAASQIPGAAPMLGQAMEIASSSSASLSSPLIQEAAMMLSNAVTANLSGLPFGGGAIAGGAVESLATALGTGVAELLPVLALFGITVKTSVKVLEGAENKVKQITGTNSKAIAAGENLANGLFKLGGQVRSFSETLAVQKQKAVNLREQLPSAREIKALLPALKLLQPTKRDRKHENYLYNQEGLQTYYLR